MGRWQSPAQSAVGLDQKYHYAGVLARSKNYPYPSLVSSFYVNRVSGIVLQALYVISKTPCLSSLHLSLFAICFSNLRNWSV